MDVCVVCEAAAVLLKGDKEQEKDAWHIPVCPLQFFHLNLKF